MKTVLAAILKIVVESIFVGIFDFLGARSRDRDLIQSGVDKAERNNAIRAAKRAQRVAEAAARRDSDTDIAGSMRDGTF